MVSTYSKENTKNDKNKGKRKSEKKKAEKSKEIEFDFWACPYQKMSQNGILLQREACFQV